MKAILQDVYGTTRSHLGDTDRAEVRVNEVLVQVVQPGIDRGTAAPHAGRPYLIGRLGFGFRGPKNPVPGRDVAGTSSRSDPL